MLKLVAVCFVSYLIYDLFNGTVSGAEDERMIGEQTEKDVEESSSGII
jgi:hypothetical protein